MTRESTDINSPGDKDAYITDLKSKFDQHVSTTNLF